MYLRVHVTLAAFGAAILATACQVRNADPVFDPQVVIQEVDSVTAEFIRALDAMDMAAVDAHFDLDRLVTAKDGVFHGDGVQYQADWRERVLSRFASIDNVQWLHSRIQALSPTSAVVTAQYREQMLTRDGATEPMEVNGAWTAVLLKTDGEWRIVAQHISH